MEQSIEMQETEPHMDSDEPGLNRVLMYSGSQEALEQPEDFRCCPLGIQLYSREDVDRYTIMSVALSQEGRNSEDADVECSGVVVHSQYEDEKKMFRIWVMFLDLSEQKRQNLTCISKENHLSCPFCENF